MNSFMKRARDTPIIMGIIRAVYIYIYSNMPFKKINAIELMSRIFH